MLAIMLAGLVGAMVGISIVFVIHYFSDKIHALSDVSSIFSSVPVGVIGRRRKSDPELTADTQPQTPMAEQFRVLAARLRRSLAADSSPNVLLVTSSIPSEGKSFITANLAIAMANSGMRIVLVDADLRRPHIHELFKIDHSRGLTDILRKEASKIPLCSSDVEGLRILPSGKITDNPDRVLNSPEMSQLFTSLKQDADLIIVDCPPILSLADTHILAEQSDGILTVVRSGRTPIRVIRDAKAMLEQLGPHLVYVVLNDLPNSETEQYAYYYGHHKPNIKRTVIQWSRKKIEKLFARLIKHSNEI
jgi:capsular exopolysaccharide synthesis family protein